MVDLRRGQLPKVPNLGQFLTHRSHGFDGAHPGGAQWADATRSRSVGYPRQDRSAVRLKSL